MKNLKLDQIRRILTLLLDNSKFIMFTLYAIGVTISGLTTFKWLGSMARDRFDFWACVGISVIFVMCNLIFYAQSLNPKRDTESRKILKRYWKVAFCISIVGSTLYLMNTTNKIYNDSLKNNFQYEEAKAEKDRLQKEIDTADIKITEINKKIENMDVSESSKSAKYKEYDTKIAKIKSTCETKINSEKSSLNNKISSKKEEKSKNLNDAAYCKSINQPKDAENYTSKANKIQNEIDNETTTTNTIISNLEKSRDEDVKKMEDEKNGFFNNKETAVSTETENLNKIISQQIADKEGIAKIDLTRYSGQQKSTEGTNTLIDAIMSVTKNKIPYNIINFIINVMVSTILELFICKLYFLSRDFSINDSNIQTPNTNNPIMQTVIQPQVTTAKKRYYTTMRKKPIPQDKRPNKIGFDTTLDFTVDKINATEVINKKNIDLDGVKKYIDVLCENVKENGTVIGYQKMAAKLGLTPNECNNTVAVLKKFNILETVNRQTYFKMSKEEAYNTLNIQ